MPAKRTRGVIPDASPLGETPGADRDLLTHAYKAGLIVAWRHDRDRGYRLTLGNRRDEYVEMTKLSSYLARLVKASA